MLEGIKTRLTEELTPLMQLWPEDQYFRLGAALIGCILLGGQLARLTMRLPLQSQQGLIALAHLVFFASGAGLLLSLTSMGWLPALQSLLAIALLAWPCYLLGRITEKAEMTARDAIEVKIHGRGMRERVLEEIREQKVDDLLFAEAQARADGDRKKTRHYYIGLRSRKLARLELDRNKLDPSSREYGRIEFELTADIVEKSRAFRSEDDFRSS